MAGRLSRFLNLERARPASDRDPRVPLSKGRFGPEPPEPDAPLVDDRLDELRRERQRALASGVVLDDQPDGEQPFLRCALCEQDNHRFAARCQNCGADLSTEEQRSFNARLWALRREEASREEAELVRFHAASASAAQAAPTGTREYGEALARQIAEKENQRLAWMDPGSSLQAGAPLGLRLLNLIANPGLRFAAALGAAGLALVLGYLSFQAIGTPNRFSLAQVLFLALVSLFLPRRPNGWHRRSSFWRSSSWFDR